MAYSMGFPPQGTPPDTRTSAIVVAASNSLDAKLVPEVYRCTGVADDVIINAALTAAAAVNGSVMLMEGDYNTVAPISVPANVTFKAGGRGAVIHFNAGGNAITLAGDNVNVRDLKVVIVAGAGGAGTRPNCIYASGRTNLDITGVWLVGDETVGDDGSDARQCGVCFVTVTRSRVALCVSEDNRRHGISLNINSNDNTVTGNTCQGNTGNGIHIDGSDDNTVTGNTCQGNTGNGIRMDASLFNTVTGNTCRGNSLNGIYLLDTSDDNTVVGNTCRGNTFNGIEFFTADNNTLTGNTCHDNVWHGIYLLSSNDNTVVGNNCFNNDINNTNTYDGISLDDSDKNLVVGNVCQSNDRWGIYLRGSDDNKIANNYTYLNGAGSITVSDVGSTNNTVEFNTVEEGAPVNAGTETRAYGNYDPSANVFVGDVGVPPF